MPIDDVLRNLESEANADIAWAFGDTLRDWCRLPDWRSSVLLQHLETKNRNLAVWNELIRNSRRALDRESELPIKARALLAPCSAGFNDVMDDFIAEMPINSCGHLDRPHYAFGLCVACYRISPAGRAVKSRYANSPKEKRLAHATQPHQRAARIRPHIRPPTMFRDLHALAQSILAAEAASCAS